MAVRLTHGLIENVDSLFLECKLSSVFRGLVGCDVYRDVEHLRKFKDLSHYYHYHHHSH